MLAHYFLYRNDQVLGEFIVTSFDFPWHRGNFRPTPAFEEVRPLFERELEILNADEADKWVEWEAAWTAIYDSGVKMRPASAVDGEDVINEFLLHIDGDEAEWRI